MGVIWQILAMHVNIFPNFTHPSIFCRKKKRKKCRKNPSQTRGIGHQAQHGHSDVGKKSDARLGRHWGCTATPLPGGHGLGGVLSCGFESLRYKSN